MQHSNKHGKVDATNGRKGMVVSLDVEEYSQFASIFGAPRIAGDDGPGELLQPFEDGLTWNVRWSKTGGESRGGEEAEEGGRSGGQLLHRRIQVVSPEGRSARHRQELCGPDLPLAPAED
uniref:Uncharacterized protein n=1 Tax=Hanusia phi TaxID=3032 RepID=A0A7S0HFR2_9CRYP|mmetsp:Transcript_24066/g.54006  ORF Transcript_24066/g.54006 Transcript_24066/m.54006 type:complete len:120 (+) Transcript_24066:74-433(+)